MMVRRILWVVLGVVSLAVLGYLYFMTKAADRGDYTTTVANLRELMRVDADWSVEVLKSQVALNKDFDMIAGFLPQIRSLKTQLKNSDLSDPDKSSLAIANQFTKTIQYLEEKEDAIERFKSNHAVLRNSVRFLPQAADALVGTAETNGLGEFAQEVRVALKDISIYLLATNETERLKVLEWLNRDIMTLPRRVADPAENFISHASLILDRKEPTDGLLELAITLPTGKAIAELVDLYTSFHENRLAGVQYYRTALVGYSGLLLFGLAFFAWKLRQSHMALLDANTALRDVNDTLETKVEERTKEMRGAYEKLKGSQAQLVQSGKMAAVGQMVAGVAHEINTPLGYVRSNIEIVKEMIYRFEQLLATVTQLDQMIRHPQPDDDKITNQLVVLDKELQRFREDEIISDMKGLIADAQHGLGQITEIVISLKDFSGIDRAVVRDFNVNDGVESALKIANNLIKNTSQLIKKYGELPTIACAPSQINQVFLNLITNAVHAIDASGRKGIIKIHTKSDNHYVHVIVQDNGTGMSEEVSSQIFDPFFTTKEGGKGTGLGLSISFNIVKEHGGHLQVKSLLGKGTVFQVSLPIRSQLN